MLRSDIPMTSRLNLMFSAYCVYTHVPSSSPEFPLKDGVWDCAAVTKHFYLTCLLLLHGSLERTHQEKVIGQNNCSGEPYLAHSPHVIPSVQWRFVRDLDYIPCSPSCSL